ncbi:MAG: 3-oxoacyl-ACP reductase FabG [Acidovorax sp.]|uniref:3-oxoacyl-ACP reductase FabG n=1 Tax=Acidovorax sp. TaxID=1872122 RepID=UPI002609432D|nr:3-oxoacyl-ACP reductase FabG [Acidovorax sp.]MDH4465351.1 3-oxoacyl-ACP reductase FabG [Acidovorax sp.]
MTETSSSTQVALVTGASRGIGAAIALELASRGYQVVGTATTDDGAQRITEALSQYPGCCGANLNVNDGAAVEALIDSIVKQQGGLHVLVNNAGITRDTLAMRMKDDDWDAVMDTNLRAVFRASRAAIRPMMKQRFGRIISITSVVGASGNPGQANYAAAKAGVAGMTRALARELGSRSITVNCVAPGFIETDMTAALPEEQQKALNAQIPLGHMGKPQDIAHAVAYLASREAGYVTGQELHVNGGMYM